MRREVRHHTDTQIEESIAFGLMLVAQEDPPDDLREAVFTQACSMHAAKQIIEETAAPLPHGMVVPRGGV